MLILQQFFLHKMPLRQYKSYRRRKKKWLGNFLQFIRCRFRKLSRGGLKISSGRVSSAVGWGRGRDGMDVGGEGGVLDVLHSFCPFHFAFAKTEQNKTKEKNKYPRTHS